MMKSSKFSDTGAVSPQMTIYSPIGGTVIQRKVGPGQYINTSSQNTSASDPTFIIGDLSTVWLVAYVREIGRAQRPCGTGGAFQRSRISKPHVPGKHFICRDIRWIQEPAACWCGQQSTTRSDCFVRKCSQA